MTRNPPKLLTGLFVLGCGSGAMAAPAHGQWTDAPGYGAPVMTAQATSQPSANDPGPHPSGMCPPSDDQGASASSSQQPSQPQPQSGYQPQDRPQGQDQDQDEDTAETHAWAAGQSHLGVVVMGLTSELRKYFGVPEDRGVLISKVEPNSAASRAGLQVGDVLVRVGPQLVRGGDDVIQALAQHAGGRIRLSVIREGRPVRLVAFIPASQPAQGQDQDRL